MGESSLNVKCLFILGAHHIAFIETFKTEMLAEYLPSILRGDYVLKQPQGEGNINYNKVFMDLCENKLDEKVTWRDAIDRLRALSFNGYKNAFYLDDYGDKIGLELYLEKEEKEFLQSP